MKKTQLGSRDLLANGGGCPVEVFCRLRPPKDNNNDQQSDNSSSCIKVSSSTELTLYSSENAKNGQIRESRYEFSHILTDNVSQSAAFKELALPLLDELIQGKSSVLFTYGITGSGKTYTMMGPLNNPGLIPRSFDVIFNSVGPYLGKKYLLRSDRQNSYEIQSESDILIERQRRDNQMLKNAKDRAKTIESTGTRTLDRTTVFNPELNENCSYFVFVTFVEVYNNYIYDLFDDDILNKAPQSKQLREDNRGRPYIRDVKEIEVRTSEEAIDLLNMGLKRRRIAHTQLNTESSRSHSVLSMRLVQFNNDIPPTSLTKDDLTISTIHLVDLAGSERVNRAKTAGERVKEAGNINSSLMVLRQCFETLRENQAQGTSKMVPYRESKLTSFFKSFFDGEGRLRMILCVNPTVDGYEEIQHALKFGELTKDVMLPRSLPPPPPVPPKLNRLPILREIDNQQQQQQKENIQPVIFTEFNAQALITPFPPFEYSLLDGVGDEETIVVLQEHLRRRLEERHRLNLLIQEQQDYLRKFTLELISDYESTMSDQNDLNKENDQQTKTIRHLQTRIKLLEKSQNDLYKTTNQIERENKTLKTQIDEKLNEIKNLKLERRKDKNDFENKLKIKLNEIEQQYINEIKNKEIKMRELERQHDDKLNIIRSMTVSPSVQQSTEHVYQNQQQYHRVEMIISQNCKTPTVNFNSPKQPITPSTEPMNIDNGNIVVAHPRQQHRRSRSLSEVWLEHRPQGTVQTETLLQPKFPKKVSRQHVPAKDDIVRTTKYVLTHQNLDAQGEIVTDFVKGDVIPSSTGGVNVIFNDVERLTCTSPPDPLVLHKRCQSEERVLQITNTISPSIRQGPAVAPKRFRM